MFVVHSLATRINFLIRTTAIILLTTKVDLLLGQTALTWDFVYSLDSRYKQSAQTLERGTDGQIIFTYISGSVYFGVYTDMAATPNVSKIYHGVRITNGTVQLYENGSLVAGQTSTVATNKAVRIERKGARMFVSIGTTATGGTWTGIFTRTTDPNKDWHPFMFDESINHSSHLPLITFSTNREDYLPDYFGNGISALSTFTSTYFPRYDSATFESTWNWTYTRTFNGEGKGECHELGQSITYFDDMGRVVQSQTKDYTNNKVWVTQTIFDRYGRPAITTLPAPKPLGGGETYPKLGYVSNFVRSGVTTANAYGTSDFDDADNYFNPAIVGNVANTLGAWYYDTDNATYSDDPGRPATQYPFILNEYSPLTGGVRYVAPPGEAFKLTGASGNYGRSFSMIAGNELTYVFGQRHPLAIISGSDVYDSGNTLSSYTTTTVNATYTKQVSVDADGKQAVVFIDSDGKEIARCLAGKVGAANVKTQTTTLYIPAGEYRDIHVTDQGSPNTTVNFSGGATYDIYNLQSYHDFSTALVVTNGTASTQSLAKGFYRVVNKSSGTTQCTLSYTLNYYNFTVNIYDLSRRLVSTIPPIAVKYNTAANSATPPTYTNAERLHFSWYRYNSLGQLIWDQTPDGGKTEYYYRKDGNIRFSQNAKQRDPLEKKFSYTNYLPNGRIEESGEAYLSTVSASILQTNANDNTWPAGATKQVSVATTYDEPPSTSSGKTQKNLVGRISFTEKKQGSSTIISRTWYSYDALGRLEWIGEFVDGNIGNKFTEYTYDLLGNSTEVVYQGASPDEFRHIYAFNNEGRLESSSTRKNNTATTLPELAVQYTYYKTGGAVKSINYHDNFKTQTYSYTLQGQLKGINLYDFNGLSPSVTNLFSMSLDYFANDFRTSMASAPVAPVENGTTTTTFGYSGQIARQRWMSGTPVGLGVGAGIFAYSYKYNHRNELNDAQFATSSYQAGVPHLLTYQSQFREYNLTYDLNGNLKTLSRNGSGTTPLTEVWNYDYTSTTNPTQNNNLLRRISGTFGLTPAGGLKNQVNTATNNSGNENYKYNAIGQLTEDITEEIKQFYDVYGNVVKVQKKNAQGTYIDHVDFVYNAAGMRSKKTGYSGTTTTITYYAYAGSQLMSIYNETIVNGSTADPSQSELPVYGLGRVGTAKPSGSNYIYRYDLKDHLGNVRAVFGRHSPGQPSTLAVDYYSDYYPYGWPLRNGASSPALDRSKGASRYGFQGKFAEKDAETGWNAFELRQYDGRMGKWMTIDPYNQFQSPYVGMGNDPVNGIDPDGGMKVYYNESGHWTKTTDNNFFHNLFFGTQTYWGGQKIESGTFWFLQDKTADCGGCAYSSNSLDRLAQLMLDYPHSFHLYYRNTRDNPYSPWMGPEYIGAQVTLAGSYGVIGSELGAYRSYGVLLPFATNDNRIRTFTTTGFSLGSSGGAFNTRGGRNSGISFQLFAAIHDNPMKPIADDFTGFSTNANLNIWKFGGGYSHSAIHSPTFRNSLLVDPNVIGFSTYSLSFSPYGKWDDSGLNGGISYTKWGWRLW